MWPCHSSRLARDAGILDKGADQLVHAPGQGRAGEGHAVTHRVAEPDLDVDAAFLPQLHQFNGKGDAEAVDIGPGHILEMAAGNDPRIEDGTDDPQILVQRLLSRLVQLQKDMVVRNGGQDPGFRQARLLDQRNILGC